MGNIKLNKKVPGYRSLNVVIYYGVDCVAFIPFPIMYAVIFKLGLP